MSDQVSESDIIEAPPETVFKAFTAWGSSGASEMKGAEILDGAVGESATVRYQMSAFGKVIQYVMRWDATPNTLVTFHLIESSMLKAMDGEFTIEPTSDGTQSKCTFSMTVDTAFPIPAIFKKRAAKSIVNSMLLSLHHSVHGFE